MKQEFNRILKCPWCGKGELLADGRAPVRVSVHCAKCNRIYIADLDTGKTERSQAQKRLGRKK